MLGTENVSESSLEGIETPKVCPRQPFKVSESGHQASNAQTAQVDGKAGVGAAPPFRVVRVGRGGIQGIVIKTT